MKKNASCYTKRGPLAPIITWRKAVCVVSGWSATLFQITVGFPGVPQRVVGSKAPSVVDDVTPPGPIPTACRDVLSHRPLIGVELDVSACGDRVVRM